MTDPICTATLVITTQDRQPYTFICQAEAGHAGNHRHLAHSGVARVWRGTGAGAELLERIRL